MPPRAIPHARAIGINIRTAFAGGPTSFSNKTGDWNQQSRKADVMRSIKLHRAIILAGAVALGSGCATVDAFARGGAGGAGGGHAGHAAASAGVAAGHAGIATGHAGIAGNHAGGLSPAATVGRVGPMHAGPGTVSVRFGNTTVTE
jgi:hypothetical protein